VPRGSGKVGKMRKTILKRLSGHAVGLLIIWLAIILAISLVLVARLDWGYSFTIFLSGTIASIIILRFNRRPII
jgi:hypothetical protein